MNHGPVQPASRRPRLRYQILGVALILFLGAIPALWTWYRRAATERAYTEPPAAGKEVNVLKSESLDQSLSRLATDVRPYVVNSATHSLFNEAFPIMLPWEGRHADTKMEYQILMVLNNRRFVKVYQALSLMPKNQAAEIVNREVERGWPVYRELFEERLRWLRDPVVPKGGVAYSWSGEGMDQSPSLAGEVFRLLGLFLIAGNLELADCRALVVKMGQQAVSDYVTLCNKEEYDELWAFDLVTRGSLYNRRVLATAVVGTCKSPAVDAVVKRHGIAWQSVDLPSYDARTRLSDPFKPDFAKGKISFKYISTGVTDEVLKDLLKAASQ